MLASALVAAGGLATAATASGLPQLLLGYGVVFGTGGGVTYILLQQGVNMLVRRRQGLVNGYIVSLYPDGRHDRDARLPCLQRGLRLAHHPGRPGDGAGGLRHRRGAARAAQRGAAGRAGGGRRHRKNGRRSWAPTFLKLSTTFFLAAAAGLMVLSQAREIVATYGGAATLAVAATTGLTGAIALARISGGWLVDRFAVPYVMCAAHALALGGGLLLTLLPAPVTAVVGLGMIGLGYGFVSGATAGGIGIYWRPADYGRVAGRDLHRLVPGRRQPAGAGRLPVRHDPRLRHGGADRRRGQCRGHGDGAHDAEARLAGKRLSGRFRPLFARGAKRRADRPDPVLDWGMPDLPKPTTDTAIAMMPTEKKVS